MSDDLDRRLRSDAALWQERHAGLNGPINFPSEFGQTANRPKRIVPLLAAAAAVAAIATGLGMAVTAKDGGDTDGRAPGSVTATASASAETPAPPAGSPDPLRPSVPPEMQDVKPANLRIVAAEPGAVSMPWRLLSVVGQKLDVEFVAGNNYCVVPVGVAVDYGVSAVSVEVISRVAHAGSCGSAGVVGRGLITLSQPLGGRELLHAPVDPAWPSSLL